MAIPMNTIDKEAAMAETAKRFREEVEQVEEYIFSKPWANEDYDHRPIAEHIIAGVVTKYKDIMITDEHWKAIVSDIKAAGYHVYRKWYHNGYYGYTKVYDHYITKVPFTLAERTRLHLTDEWGQAYGPGREQMRGEML